jgi:hypothetical protein
MGRMTRQKSVTTMKQETRSDYADGLTSSRLNDSDAFAEPTQEAIRERAYEIYIRRGAGQGSEIDDWQTAERELTAAAKRPRRKA